MYLGISDMNIMAGARACSKEEAKFGWVEWGQTGKALEL